MTLATGSASFQFNGAATGDRTGKGSGTASFEFDGAAKSTVILIYNSQEALLTEATRSPLTSVSQLALMYMGIYPAMSDFTSQIAVLTNSQITAKQVNNSQEARLAVGANPMTDTNTSQIAVLSMVRSNPDRRQMRAWPFYMDGHWFYVLHLGNLTTLVFDTLTRKWSEWKSTDYNIWRANYGVNWNEDIIGGSVDSNLIFQISPNVSDDTGKAIVSIITGGFPMRMRDNIRCDEVIVTSSVGVSTPVGAATMQLRGSDDYGLSWQDYGTLDLSLNNPRGIVTWQSLGEIASPGRIFEITDSGAAKRINSLDMYSRDLNDG